MRRLPMKFRSIRFILIALVAGATLVAACDSGSSGEVTLVDMVNDDFDGGEFTATGSVACDAGETNSLDTNVDESLWWYESEFTCADGSGAFVLRGELPPPPDPDSAAASEPIDGTWTVQSGSGDYTHLEGSGALTTDPGTQSATYTGTMTNS